MQLMNCVRPGSPGTQQCCTLVLGSSRVAEQAQPPGVGMSDPVRNRRVTPPHRWLFLHAQNEQGK